MVLKTTFGVRAGPTTASWPKAYRAALEFIQPGKSTQRPDVQRFLRASRGGLLDPYVFNNVCEALGATDGFIVGISKNAQ
jgi:hypothetical protein